MTTTHTTIPALPTNALKKQIAYAFNVSCPTLWKAERDGRLRRDADVWTLTIHRGRKRTHPSRRNPTVHGQCAVCKQTSGRVRANRICEACKRAGHRWCQLGQHVVSIAEYNGVDSCFVHRRDYVNRRNAIARQAQPPAGYVLISLIAERIGFAPSTIRRWIRNGWMRGSVWQYAPLSPYWIADMAPYPPPLYEQEQPDEPIA